VVTSGSEDSGVLEGALARALLAELVAAPKADPVLRRDVVALLQPTRSPSTSDERLMTVAEVAAAVKLSERSVYRALRNGRLRGDRVGSSWRISSAAVDEWKGGRTLRTAARPLPRRPANYDVARRALAA